MTRSNQSVSLLGIAAMLVTMISYDSSAFAQRVGQIELPGLEHDDDSVNDWARSPDGRYLAIATESSVVMLTASGDQHLWTERFSLVRSRELPEVAFSADSKSIAIVAQNNFLSVLSSEDGEQIASCDLEESMDDMRPEAICWDSEQDRFVIANTYGKIAIVDWNSTTSSPPKRINQFKAFEDDLNGMWLSPDGSRLITAGDNEHGATLKVHSIPKGTLVTEVHWQSEEITAISVSSDGKTLATLSENDTINVYEVSSDSLKKLSTYDVPGQNLPCLTLSPNGRYLAVPSSWNGTKIFDLSTEQQITHLPPLRFSGLWFTMDSSRLIGKVADADFPLVILDIESLNLVQQPQSSFLAFQTPVVAIDYHAQSQTLSLLSRDQYHLYDRKFNLKRRLPTKGIESQLFTRGGDVLLTSSSSKQKGKIYRWVVAQNRIYEAMNCGDHTPEHLSMSRTHKYMFRDNDEGSEVVATEAPESPLLNRKSDYCVGAAFSPNEQLIAIDEYRRIVLVDLNSKREITRTESEGLVGFSHDSKAVLGIDNNRIWKLDVSNGRVRYPIPLHGQGSVTNASAMCVHPSKSLVAVVSGKSHKHIRLFNHESGELLVTLEGSKDEITTLTFVGDSQLVAGDESGNVTSWDVSQWIHDQDPKAAIAAKTPTAVQESDTTTKPRSTTNASTAYTTAKGKDIEAMETKTRIYETSFGTIQITPKQPMAESVLLDALAEISDRQSN